MAIQRVGGYVYSCAPCGVFYPARSSYDQALQDEVDHHRIPLGDPCACPILKDKLHHAPGCALSRLRPAGAPSEPTSGAGTP